MAKTEGYCVL